MSGTGDKSSLSKVIRRENERMKIDFEIGYTNGPGNYEFLIHKIANECITDVVVCGGDGSVNSVAAALSGIDVNIGIIPQGSGNGLARSAGIPIPPKPALQLIFSGKASYIDGFFINDQFSCMLCGIGFDAKVAHDFAGEKRRGLNTYIRKIMANYFSAKAYNFEILSHDNRVSARAYFISVANSNQFGNNFTIAPQAQLNDGLLDIVVVKKMSKFLLPFFLLRQVKGINTMQDINGYTDGRNIIYFQTPELTIINKDEAPLHIDGEPKNTSKKFLIKVVPNAFRLIQPVASSL